MGNPISLWTIGHSTLSIEDFISKLKSFEIQVLADVRSYPGSRRYPHFNREKLSASLADTGIRYEHFPELGGRRRARPDSLNIAWRNESFRGYADYLETNEFRAGIDRLLNIATTQPTAIMCSEAVWWRCHRGLIADYLKAQGHKVLHIQSATKAEEHPFTVAASIVNGKLSYRAMPAEAELAL